MTNPVITAPTDIRIPFGLNEQGGIAKTSDAYRIAGERVEALIATNTGERVMLPTYGVPLGKFLFGPDNSNDALITLDIKGAMKQWEPAINVVSVTPVPTQDGSGIDNVSVEFTISPSQLAPTLVATVLVGGTVVPN